MKQNKMFPEKGKLLISDPFLPDPSFRRSVILLTDYKEEGAMGFILNKPINAKIHEIIPDFPDIDVNTFYGGPVGNDSLFVLHRHGDAVIGSVELFDGLYLGGNFEMIKLCMETNIIKPDEIKLFLGYSGWDKNQLLDELNDSSWLIADSKMEYILSQNTDNLWKDVLKGLGGKYAQIANYPENPNFN